MTNTPQVSVVVVAYHALRWLPACLESLAGASKRRLHLVLVDNAGENGLDQLPLDQFDTEVLKTPHPMGFAEANNFALTHASRLEDFVLFLNQDTVSRSAWIDASLACFSAERKLAALSPVIRKYEFDGWDTGYADCLRAEGVEPQSAPRESPEGLFRAANAPATALIVRTDVLRLVGPFDPVFGSYYEDYDLCRRIRGAGFEVGFCMDAEIGHFAGSSTTTRSRELLRMRQVLRNRLLYKLRESGDGRPSMLARYVLRDLPWNLARGIARTPTSQPPTITLRAAADLLRIGGRLVSRSRDEERWLAYLASIGWPPAGGSATYERTKGVDA